MATILDKIVEAKRESLERAMAETPLGELERRVADAPPAAPFAAALRGDDIRLIAEVKKASPSGGLLRADFDPAGLASAYAEHGAAAVSCLTDAHFEGTLEHLREVKAAVAASGVPVLRKDFLTHRYQLYEARAYGADAALLIVRRAVGGAVARDDARGLERGRGVPGGGARRGGACGGAGRGGGGHRHQQPRPCARSRQTWLSREISRPRRRRAWWS